MSRQHLARDLRVTWLVCAQQAEISQAKEEKKSAEASEQQPVDVRARSGAAFDVSFPGE